MATYPYDVVVYGPSESGILAAIAAKRELGATGRVALICPTANIDNFSANGLMKADIGKTWDVGGLYLLLMAQKLGQIYGKPKQWTFGSRRVETYFAQTLGTYGVEVVTSERISRPGGVSMASGPARITGLTMESGNVYTATVYIDASYMGDVLTQVTAKGTGWTIGRESAATYGESLAGFLPQVITSSANGYVSGTTLHPCVTPYPTGRAAGDADAWIQCPGIRTPLNDSAQFKLSWDRVQTYYPPVSYNTAAYGYETQRDDPDREFIAHPVEMSKCDKNDNTILTDGAGTPLHFGYAEASYATRATIDAAIRNHVLGRFLYYATDPARAGTFQDELATYGLDRQEFDGTTNFLPRMVYHREGPRMIGATVLKQSDLQTNNTKATSIAVGGYSMDIHQSAYLINPADPTTTLTEGATTTGDQIHVDGYAIPFEALLPQSAHCTNLLVPYCASVSHVAWASYRIITANAQAGEAAGVAAGMVINGATTLHALSVPSLRTKLAGYNCVIDPAPDPGGEEDEDDGDDDEVGG